MAPPKTIMETATQSGNVTSIGARLSAPSTYQLTLSLQTTLELDQLIGIFSREAYDTVRHDACVYRTPSGDQEITIGNAGRHSANYDLNLSGERLGSLTFYRQQRFSENDLVQLEYLLSALIYPLRNALHFREAKMAAYKDPLTALCNRAAMQDTLNREIDLAKRKGTELALLAIDLDYFKLVNDQHGHTVGDTVLKATADRMRAAMRTSDLLFRFGGEEFVAVLSQTGPENARVVAERMRESLAAAPIVVEGKELSVTISIGIAGHQGGDDPQTLFDRADQALYSAKRSGRNRVELFAN